MEFLKKRDKQKAIELIQWANSVEDALRQMIEKKNQLENEFRDLYEEAKSQSAFVVIANTPIERLNTGKYRINIKSLEQAGISNVAQVIDVPKDKLVAVNGIGDVMAQNIIDSSKELYDFAKRNAVVKIDPDNKSQLMNKMVQTLCYLNRQEKLIAEVQRLYDANHDSLSYAVQSAELMCSPLKYFFSGKKKKQHAKDSVSKIESLSNDGYGDRVNNLVQEYNDIFDIPVEECWQDYTGNASSYYAKIEKVVGSAGESGTDSNAAESVVTGKRASGLESVLPDELVKEINEQELDTSLLKATLRSYQEFGAKYIVHQKRTLLGDEMGLGKTLQAIASMAHLAAKGNTHFLVICPLSVLVNWEREIQKFSGMSTIAICGDDRQEEFDKWIAEGGVGITTYETTVKLEVPVELEVAMVTVDEAHYIKNPQAQRTIAVGRLLEKAEYNLLMSGTPLENRIEEMLFLVNTLNKEVGAQIEELTDFTQADKFRLALAPVYLRRNKEAVLKELPDLQEKEDWGILTKEEGKVYDETLADGNFMSIRQISWNLPDFEESTKAKRLLEICEAAKEQDRKVLIFTFFKDTIEKVMKLLGDDCVGYINGSISPDERQKLVDKFEKAGAGAALVSQVVAGGVGLNIQAASVVIFCEPQIKPSMETQAVARAYRMGQTRNVLVHRLLIEDSIDDAMMEVLKQKQTVFDSFADESVTGVADIEINEKALGELVEQEKKNRGIA